MTEIVIKIALTPELYALLKKQALEKNMPVSSYISEVIKDVADKVSV